MQRRSFLKSATVGVAAGTIAAPAIASRNPPSSGEWRKLAKSLDTLFGAAEFVTKRVSEITDGKFQIRVFAAGEIVPALQVLDAVQAGTVEMGHTASYYYFGKDPAFALGTSVPFGPTTRQSNAWWYFGGGAEAMARCTAVRLHSDSWRQYREQMGGWFRGISRSMISRLKFRIGGMAGLVLAKLGRAADDRGPISTPRSKGTIDGASGLALRRRAGFQQVAQYYYYGLVGGGPMLPVLVEKSERAAELSGGGGAACGEANVWMPAKYDAQNPEALRRLVSGGTKLRAFPKSVMEASEKAAYEVYEELKAKSAHWKRIYPGWKKFRDDEFLWFRVAEATYDNYAFFSKLGEGK
jgi:TRAP-type mannitol/chloroaromatic compound transport system substrate-binding protein